MFWFVIATSTPVALLFLAGLFGGVWALTALLYMTLFVFSIDHLTTRVAASAGTTGEFPSGSYLSVFLAIVHFPLLGLAVMAVSGGNALDAYEQVFCFLAFGVFFGQVSNANAHELIHARHRWARRLGTWVYISLLFGHHASAHTKVHHVWVATERDPNSPLRRHSFYRFWPRAWFGSFSAGLAAENALRQRAAVPAPIWRHPYVTYIGGALLVLGLTLGVAGPAGGLALIGLAAYAQMQLLLSDYVQHYGLTRSKDAAGKPEPVSAAHSWNAPHFYSSAMMLNAPRHSDHHMHPARRFPALQLDGGTMPMLPYPLPAMALIALWPPLWRRVMDPRVAALRASRE